MRLPTGRFPLSERAARKDDAQVIQTALFFFLIMLADMTFGFTGVPAAAADIAALLFYIFSFLLVLSLVMSLRTERKHLSVKPGK
jgi:uncharacterized membrane protein YtjA (UPF0391 family)